MFSLLKLACKEAFMQLFSDRTARFSASGISVTIVCIILLRQGRNLMTFSLSPRKSLKVVLLLAVLFLVQAVEPQPLQADDIEKQMRELLAEAGPFPEAVARPRDPVNSELTIRERFNRIWNNFLGFRVTYATARGKACHANQRVIAGAIEMYNMDNATMMKTLRHDDAVMASGALVRGLYLKNGIRPPESDCEYFSFGDLTKNGIVYCRRHGTIEPYYKAIAKVAGVKMPVDERAENLQIALAGMVGLILISMAVLIVLFFSRRQSSEASDADR